MCLSGLEDKAAMEKRINKVSDLATPIRTSRAQRRMKKILMKIHTETEVEDDFNEEDKKNTGEKCLMAGMLVGSDSENQFTLLDYIVHTISL